MTHGYLQAKGGKFSSFNTDHVTCKTENLYHCLLKKKCQLSWLKAKAEPPNLESSVFFHPILPWPPLLLKSSHSQSSWNCFLKRLSKAAVLGPCSYYSMGHDSGLGPNDLTAPISLLRSGHVLSPLLPPPCPVHPSRCSQAYAMLHEWAAPSLVSCTDVSVERFYFTHW